MPGSLNSILSTVRTALQSHQIAMQVASHNLANSTVEGYSRQRAELVTGVPLRTTEGLLGTGVRVADITRARNAVLDGAVRRESSLFAAATLKRNVLAGIETAVGEPGDLGLGATLDAFWDAFSDLANDPASLSARAVVVARGELVVDHVHRVNDSLARARSEALDALTIGVDEVNSMLSEIASLNREIVSARAGGQSAPDLEDRRDLLIDQLGSFIPVESTPRANGAVGVVSNGVSVVEGTVYQTLSTSSVGGALAVQTESGVVIPIDTGTVGASLDILNGDLDRMQTQIDEIAQGLVERVNAIHVTGTNPLGNTGVNFFDDLGDPTTVTAGTLALDAAILADSQAVAAGTPGGSGEYRSGANDVALLLAGLRDDTTGGVLDGRSVNDAFRDLVADIGLTVGAALEDQESHGTLLATATERRESVSGVSTDEELINVIQIQAAFSAAARVVSTVDEMYQTLLTI